MTKRERRILEALAAADRYLYGLDLVAVGAASPWWMYAVLGRLEDRGLIEGHPDDASDPPGRRQYRITDAGRAALLPVAKVH